LLFKHRKIGIVGSLLTLLASYLENRSHLVAYASRQAPLKYERIAVYCKAPSSDLFFFLYINNIFDNIHSSISRFDDDATLYISSKFPSHLHQVLSEDLLTSAVWSVTWGVWFIAKKQNCD